MEFFEFTNSESTDCEFKLMVNRDKPKNWLKCVSAFANTCGGTVYFGVDDDHDVVGVYDPQDDIEYISQTIHDRIDPVPRYSLSSIETDGKTVIVLEVQPSKHVPHYYQADGRREVFVRNGDRSEQASTEHLNDLILRGMHQTWDALDSGIPVDHGSFSVLKSSFAFRTGKSIEDSDLASFGLLATDGKYLTNAGALLADEPLMKHSRIFCTRWTGDYKDNPVDDAEFTGNLLVLLREAEAFIKRHNIMSWEKKPTYRVEYRCYSERAVTEALVNALVHRSYVELGSEIHVDIYDDRLTISSPGEMPQGDLPADVVVQTVESHRRNPIIADVFGRMHLMERRGSGLREICLATAAEATYKPEFKPRFDNAGGIFRVVLANMKYEG